jgi:hypothetical protein
VVGDLLKEYSAELKEGRGRLRYLENELAEYQKLNNQKD